MAPLRRSRGSGVGRCVGRRATQADGSALGIGRDGTMTNPFNLDKDCTFYFHSRGAFDFTPVCER